MCDVIGCIIIYDMNTMNLNMLPYFSYSSAALRPSIYVLSHVIRFSFGCVHFLCLRICTKVVVYTSFDAHVAIFIITALSHQ